MATDESHGMFATWRGYWNFQRSVSRELRYVRTSETEAFLAAVLETSASRRVTIPAGQLYWRAQLGHDWRPMGSACEEEIPCAYTADRMKPLPGRAWDGRANPRGIPCLYVATTKETAMSEVRPWVGSRVSVGQFRTQRELNVVDCARHHTGVPFHFEEPGPEERANAVWKHIDQAFAEPMTRSDDQADYTATQILAELFKHAGLDGVVYRSNFGPDGFNIALFDPNVAELINCGLYRTRAMQPEFEEADPFYTVAAGPGTE